MKREREREKEKEFFEIADDVRGSTFYIIEEQSCFLITVRTMVVWHFVSSIDPI